MSFKNKYPYLVFFLVIALNACAATPQSTQVPVSFLGGRSPESIRLEFESVKVKSFSIYEKHLVKSPKFGGELLFRVVIQPGGAISDIDLLDNTTGSVEFGNEVLELLKELDFSKEDVKEAVIVYTYAYMPS